MTAAEKAKQLVEKFFIEIQDMSWTEHKICVECARQCALIAVDEIEKDPTTVFTTHRKEYWQQVKSEIEKL